MSSHTLTHSLSPPDPLSPFLSTLFRSFLPVRFSSYKSVSSPAVAQERLTLFQLSKSWDSWSPRVARHMLKLLGGGWWWLATEASQNNPSHYVRNEARGVNLVTVSAYVCMCSCVLRWLTARPTRGWPVTQHAPHKGECVTSCIEDISAYKCLWKVPVNEVKCCSGRRIPAGAEEVFYY